MDKPSRWNPSKWSGAIALLFRVAVAPSLQGAVQMSVAKSSVVIRGVTPGGEVVFG